MASSKHLYLYLKHRLGNHLTFKIRPIKFSFHKFTELIIFLPKRWWIFYILDENKWKEKSPTEASTEYTTACCLELSIVDQWTRGTEAKQRRNLPFIEKPVVG